MVMQWTYVVKCRHFAVAFLAASEINSLNEFLSIESLQIRPHIILTEALEDCAALIFVKVRTGLRNFFTNIIILAVCASFVYRDCLGEPARTELERVTEFYT